MNITIAGICCAAPMPAGTPPGWFWLAMGIFIGVAVGVMLMAIAQRYGKRWKRKQFERVGNPIGAAITSQRWNGRYPTDAERRHS